MTKLTYKLLLIATTFLFCQTQSVAYAEHTLANHTESTDHTALAPLTKTAPTPPTVPTDTFIISADPDEIKITTYNVQNLFDTEHDEGKLDHTYLPANNPLKKTGCPQIKSSLSP